MKISIHTLMAAEAKAHSAQGSTQCSRREKLPKSTGNEPRTITSRFSSTISWGFRIGSYREQAIESLHLKAGDTVVDIGCGTGANFPLLVERVGQDGKIIGVDFTDAMLAKARDRVERSQWRNIELVQSDAASYQFPGKVDGVISTFAIIYVPEFDNVIRNGSRSLVAGGRLVILDFKLPNRWTSRFAPYALVDTRPWGLSMEMASRHPWESIAKYLKDVRLTERYGGFVFIAVGEHE